MQRQKPGWRNDGNQALFEITRIASDTGIGLTLGRDDHLHSLFNAAPTKCRCLLQ
jgi:hypothetical protein